LERINLIFFIIGIILIVVGVILKHSSPILVGDILSLLGVIISLGILFRDQTNRIVKTLSIVAGTLDAISENQTKTLTLLEAQQKVHEEQLEVLKEIRERPKRTI
jgi:uncharacterized protein (DUF697 family)